MRESTDRKCHGWKNGITDSSPCHFGKSCIVKLRGIHSENLCPQRNMENENGRREN